MMTYKAVNSIFQQCHIDTNAAEIHGMATAMLCMEISCEAANWLNEVFVNNGDDIFLTNEDRTVLMELFEQTRMLLDCENEQFAFDLFLPEDEVTFAEQAESLRHWCQGFLFGVGFGDTKNEWPEDCRGILKDLVEFTKLEVENHSEEEENALMEIHQYLRTAVLVFRNQLNTHLNVAKQ